MQRAANTSTSGTFIREVRCCKLACSCCIALHSLAVLHTSSTIPNDTITHARGMQILLPITIGMRHRAMELRTPGSRLHWNLIEQAHKLTLPCLQGPDGRGGRTKVLMPSIQVGQSKTQWLWWPFLSRAALQVVRDNYWEVSLICQLASFCLQTFMTSARQKGVRAKAPMPPVAAIKRHKGPSARGGGAITIQHFFDAAEQDTGCGDENGPPQRGY